MQLMHRSWWGAPSLVAAVGLLGALPFACLPDGERDGSDDDGGSGGTPLTVVCEDHCAALHPNGVAAYEAFRSCLVCGACHDRCNAELGGYCSGGTELGCSAMTSSCFECTNSACAADQLPDTSFMGACAAQGNACSTSPDCVAIHNCAANCIVTTGPGGTGGGGGMGMGGASASGSAVSSSATGF